MRSIIVYKYLNNGNDHAVVEWNGKLSGSSDARVREKNEREKYSLKTVWLLYFSCALFERTIRRKVFFFYCVFCALFIACVFFALLFRWFNFDYRVRPTFLFRFFFIGVYLINSYKLSPLGIMRSLEGVHELFLSLARASARSLVYKKQVVVINLRRKTKQNANFTNEIDQNWIHFISFSLTCGRRIVLQLQNG